MTSPTGRQGAGVGRTGEDAVLAGVLGSAALIAVVTVAARVTGFGRWLAFSHSVGGTCTGQAYNTANLLPNVLFEVAAGGALAGAVVPLLAGAVTRGAREEVDRTASALLTWAVVVLAPLALLLALVAGPLTRALLPAPACAGQQGLAATMLVVFAPQVLLYGVGTVLTGVLQAHRRFLWPALAPLLSSVVVIVSYLAYGRTGSLAWLAGGTTAGVVVMTLPLLVPLWRNGIRLRPTLRFAGDGGSRAVRLATAGIAGLLAQQAFVVISLALANWRGRADTITVFNYTQAVYLLPYAVLAVPVATAAFPRLADRASAGDTAAFAALAARSTRTVVAAGLVGSALVAATAPAVTGFFAALDRGTVTGMETALVALAPGLVGYALLAHVSRALYALHRGRAAAAAAAAGWSTAAVVAVVAAAVLDEPASMVTVICAASSVGMTVAGVALTVALRTAAGPLALQGIRRTAWAGVLGAVVAAVAGSWVAGRLLDLWGRGIVGALGAAIGAAAVAAAVVAVSLRAADPGLFTARPTGSARLLVVLGTSGGGTGRHVRALVHGLVADGVDVVVAGPASTQEQFDFVAAGATFVELPFTDHPHPVRDLVTLARLWRLERGADVVHAHGLRAGALAALASAAPLTWPGTRRPVVVTLHNALVGVGRTAAVHGVLERIVARGARAVLVVSGDLGARMRDLGVREVARALVPAPALAPVDPGGARSEVRQEFGLAPGEALLVTVARLAPQKGLELLLDAVGLLREPDGDTVHVRAVVAGEGPLRVELQRRVDDGGLPVRLLGHRSDVARLLAAADVVVVPSVWEGQPLVVQEALRAGAAVVATDVGGTAEVGGDAVRLVPYGDPAALAATIRAELTALADPDRRLVLRERSLRRAARLPTDADALSQVEDLYARVAACWAPAPRTTDTLEPRGTANS